jgi:hypothetical protein
MGRIRGYWVLVIRHPSFVIILKRDLLKLKYYLLLLALALGVFVYAGLRGQRYIGSDSSKWTPSGQQRYHK